MIFKSLCLQKPLLESEEFGTCYAGRGLRSGTPRWGYPSHRYRGGPHSFSENFGFSKFFLHCQKRQFDELGKLANIVTRFSNTEEILNLSP